ncbi:hypothetical protein NPIL_585111 [Nephila pilipes]|uniref:Uncharacterized protein n=1 Tax=Nephila pilipes TaxID=299642 RepID=A0A8X6QP97_NEPPI|nr:hypothetical protein NPIL_585111 [Nephila pilipes]
MKSRERFIFLNELRTLMRDNVNICSISVGACRDFRDVSKDVGEVMITNLSRVFDFETFFRCRSAVWYEWKLPFLFATKGSNLSKTSCDMISPCTLFTTFMTTPLKLFCVVKQWLLSGLVIMQMADDYKECG